MKNTKGATAKVVAIDSATSSPNPKRKPAKRATNAELKAAKALLWGFLSYRSDQGPASADCHFALRHETAQFLGAPQLLAIARRPDYSRIDVKSLQHGFSRSA